MNSSVIKKIFLSLVICFSTGSFVLASDNVLQAIQIDGVNDSYNIILKSDDVAEVKTTVQAPNKMIINLKGIRASKTINTIYNNTSNVDSVVVEPVSEDTVKILVQAPNVADAKVNFDSLKTPLALENNSNQNASAGNETKSSDGILLSEPTTAYRPVYNNDDQSKDDGFNFGGTGLSIGKMIKKLLKGGKSGWLVTAGLFSLLVASGMTIVKAKDNEIKIGLSQSLKDRELDLYGSPNEAGLGVNYEVSNAYPNTAQNAQRQYQQQPQNLAGSNYGLRAYQQGVKSPYITSEIQKKKPMPTQTPAFSQQNVAANSAILKQQLKANAQHKQPSVAAVASKPIAKSSSNIDSMKFLESMTKIYEKNGRSDLAQGLKTNIKKAKINIG